MNLFGTNDGVAWLALSTFLSYCSAALTNFSSTNLHAKSSKVSTGISTTFHGAFHGAGARNTSLHCGGTVNGDFGTGVLTYKEDTPLEPNERCVWIIRSSLATRYFLHVKNLGFANPSPDAGLIISGFARQMDPNHFIPANANMHYPMYNSSILVVTLYTGNLTDIPVKGFTIHYEALNHDTSVPYASPKSSDLVINSDAGVIKYPAGGNYDDYELAAFAFVPFNNTFRSGRDIEVIYEQVKLEPGCYDHLAVYYFNSGASGRWSWDFQGRICDDVDTSSIANPDMILVLFETDGSEVDAGFKFYYSSTCLA